MTRRTRAFAAISLLAALGSAAPAAAADAKPATAETPTDLDAARQTVFAEAVQAMLNKDWATCRVKALGVWTQKQHPQVAALLGICEEQLKLYPDAAEHLDYHRKNDAGKSADRTKEVEESWKRVQPKVAIWEVTANVADVDVKVNGKPRGLAPITLYLEAGSVTLEAKKEGYKSQVLGITANAGEQQKKVLAMVVDKDAPPPPSEGRPMWPGWLIGGVGLAGVGAGAALLGIGQAKLGDAEDAGSALRAANSSCEPPTGSASAQCGTAQDALDSAAAMSTAGIVVMGVGGAALIGGIVYLVLPQPKAEQVGFVPWVSRESAGVTVGGVW